MTHVPSPLTDVTDDDDNQDHHRPPTQRGLSDQTCLLNHVLRPVEEEKPLQIFISSDSLNLILVRH